MAYSVATTPAHATKIFDRLVRNNLDPADVAYIPPPPPVIGGLARRDPVAALTQSVMSDDDTGAYALSGQFGSGKSTALHQLRSNPQVSKRFLVIEVNARDRLALDLSIRELLLMLAEALAKSIHGPLKKAAENLPPELGQTEILREWVTLLSRSSAPQQPLNLVGLAGGIDIGVAKLNFELKTDTQRRAALRDNAAYDVTSVMRLTAALGTIAQRAAKLLGFSGVLLIVDDLDKFRDRSLLQLFERELKVLADLPFKIIVTLPYYLNFESRAREGLADFTRCQIPNAKIVTVDSPLNLLPAGRDFFVKLYSQYASPLLFGPAENLAASAAFDDAVLLSAGIPREFYRVLHHAFDICDYNGESVLTKAHVRAASIQLAQTLIQASQLASTRGSLKVVRLTQNLETAKQWMLLDSLQVVEYVNDRPWYSVHPTLQAWIDEELVDDAVAAGLWTRVTTNGGPPTAEHTARRMLDELSPAARTTLLERVQAESRLDDQRP